MNCFLKVCYECIITQVNSFMKGGLPLISNYYGISTDYEYGYFLTKHTLIIKQVNRNFSRLYFLTRDIGDLSNVLNSLDDSIYVFNIPIKNELGIWQSLLKNIPFEQYGKYYRYYNRQILSANELLHTIANADSQIESAGFKLCKLANISDLEEILNLIYDTFDIYTDHLPTDSQLKKIVENRRVYVNRCPDDSICGFVVFENIGKKCYQNFWVDTKELGLYLMRKLYEQMVDNNIIYTNFWIADWNKSVIKLHKMLGSLPDGMMDVTYVKR